MQRSQFHPPLEGSSRNSKFNQPVIPAKAGIQDLFRHFWMPASAGMTIFAGVSLALPASAADIPDLSGFWGRNPFDFEPVPSAPPPTANLSRLPSGSSDPPRPAGDYNNP